MRFKSDSNVHFLQGNCIIEVEIWNGHCYVQVLDEIQVLWRYGTQEAMHGVERGECKAMLTVEQSNCFIIAKGSLSAYEACARTIDYAYIRRQERNTFR